MNKLLMAIALASMVGIGLTGCVENTSASSNTTPRQTQVVCDFAGNIETHTVISNAVDSDYSYGYISINYTSQKIVYPAHACKVTRFK